MLKKRYVLLPLVAAISLAACSSGGGSGGSVYTSGTAVDGYLSGSTVFCDANKNGVFDQGEAYATTSTNGKFSVPGACGSTLAVQGGLDTSTNHDFQGLLKAPDGSAYVTPLTTLIAETNLGIVRLANALSLPVGTDVKSLDPMAAAHFDLRKKTVAVQQIMLELGKSLEKKSAPGTNLKMYTEAANALAAVFANDPNAVLFGANGQVDANVIAAILAEAEKRVGKFSAADKARIIDVIVAKLNALLATKNPGELDDEQTDQQDPSDPGVDLPSDKNGYLYLAQDRFVINGTEYNLNQFVGKEITVSYPLSSLTFEYGATADLGGFNKEVHTAVNLEEVGGEGRVLQVKVEGMNVERAENGVVTLSLAHDAKVIVFARNNSGEFKKTFKTNELPDRTLVINRNNYTLNYENLVNRVINSSYNTTSFKAESFINMKGTFKAKTAVTGNLNVRYSNGQQLDRVNTGIFTTDKGVEGPGIEGTITIK